MNARILGVVQKPWFIPTVVGVATFCGGFAAGFYFGSQREFVFEPEEELDIVEEQLTIDFEAKEEDGLDLITDPEFREEVKASRERVKERERREAETVIISSPNPDPRQVEDPDFLHRNDDDWDHWDYSEEASRRSLQKPYIIHRDEFWGEELEYEQTTLTYYVGDDILVDDKDVPIYDYLSVTGPLLFGHGSGDRNVVFVRNHAHEAEYEVLRDDSSYEKEILGIQAEEDAEREDVQHTLRKFKPQDE